MPKPKATADLRCQEFPEEGLKVIKSRLKCTFCDIFINYEKKSVLALHLKSQSHLKCKGKSSRQSNADSQKERKNEGEPEPTQWDILVKVFVGAGIPLKFLENKEVLEWMKKYVKNGSSFPSFKTLRNINEKGYINPKTGTKGSAVSTMSINDKTSKTIEEILHNQCAHCSTQEEQKTYSTTIKFLNPEIESGILQEIANFQGICEVYGILPNRLDSSMKKHLKTLTNESDISFCSQTFKKSFTEDSSNPFRLNLCQNCCQTLTELYSVHHTFTKLSNENSIISKSLESAKSNDFIKLENECDTETFSDHNDTLDFNDSSNNSENEMNEPQIKEEPADPDCLLSELDSTFDEKDEEINHEVLQTTEMKHAPIGHNAITENFTGRKTRQRTSISFQKRVKEKYDSCESSDDFSASEGSSSDSSYSYKKKKSKRQIQSRITKCRSSNKIIKKVKKQARLIYSRQKQLEMRKNSFNDNPSDDYDEDVETKDIKTERYDTTKDKQKQKQHYGCRICFEDFQTQHKLKMHRLTHFGEPLKVTHHVKGPPYGCPGCAKSYKALTSLQFHAAVAHRLKVPGKFDHVSSGWNCEDCTETFEDPGKMQIHYESCHSKKYFCRYCYIAFSSEIELNSHTTSAHKKPGIELKFKPALRVKWRSKLMATKKRKMPVQHYPCKKCGKVFSTPYKRKIHKLLHIEGVQTTTETIKGPPFICPRCEKSYKSFVCFNEHSIIRHKVKYPSTVTRYCTKCNLEFSNTIDLENHCRSVHGIEYFCKYCNKYFTAAASLRLHEASHEEKVEKYLHADIETQELEDESTISPAIIDTEKEVPRAFRCRSCKQVFETYKMAKVHERMHKTGEIAKPGVTCEQCGKYFQNRSDLFSHKYTHTTLKPHMCEKCGRSFKRRTELTKHAVDHEQVENGITSQCDLCGKTFKHSTSLRRHISRFHRDKRKPECPLCHKSFSNRYNVRIHLKICKAAPSLSDSDVINNDVPMDLPHDICTMQFTPEFRD